ncbi:hypothetical protein [Aquabacterium sp.]|uniref:hypothetical protein n=1 Tax=Aquabacterium sp. TaxID=1872578 RepID=UPI002C6D10FA|nr:hypothetical protein [Aquabacterium sp.]HSW03820.1 hypothetical protein [Aquabacterium sp.]
MMLALLCKALGAVAQPATVSVDFRLTRYESDEGIPGAAVRLVLGDAAHARQADTGHRFVTEAEGRARFTMPAVIDRRWISVPVAQTGLSVPRRVDHLHVAVELEQTLPLIDAHPSRPAEGRLLTQPWLHLLDIHCISAGSCATSDIGSVYAPDANGQWTRPVRFGQTSPQLPELGGLALSEPGYRTASFLLTPEGEDRSRWTLRLIFQRKPVPVRR